MTQSKDDAISRTEFHNIISELRNEIKILQDTLTEFTIRHKNENILKLKVIPIIEAKPLILTYLRNHQTAWMSEIAEGLEIDYEVVIQVLEELTKEGVIRPKDV